MYNKLTLVATATHTDTCTALRMRRLFERGVWIARFPRYCTDCRGFGGRTIEGSLYEPPIFEHCIHCLDQGICPRCHATGVSPSAPLYGKPVCASCGWTGNHDDDHLPFVPQCLCELDGNDDPLGPLDEYPF